MPLNNPTEPTVVKYGIYTGDDSANQVVYHGMKVVPKIVLIFGTGADESQHAITISAPTKIIHFGNNTVAPARYTVVQMTSTAFRVGDGTNHYQSANGSGDTYAWVGIA